MPAAAPAIVVLDNAGEPLDCRAKVCSGTGLNTLKLWLAESDVLFLSNRRGQPLVLLSWTTWNRVARAGLAGALPNSTPEEPPSDARFSSLARVR
jgi:hypothetical protein